MLYVEPLLWVFLCIPCPHILCNLAQADTFDQIFPPVAVSSSESIALDNQGSVSADPTTPAAGALPGNLDQALPPEIGKIGRGVVVNNMTWWTTDRELFHLLSAFGKVASLRIYSDKSNGMSLGFGYAEFTDGAACQRASAGLNGHEVHGKPLAIEPISAYLIKQYHLRRQRELEEERASKMNKFNLHHQGQGGHFDSHGHGYGAHGRGHHWGPPAPPATSFSLVPS